MPKENTVLRSLRKNQNILLVSTGKGHNKAMINLHKSVSNKFKRILAIITHKSASSLESEFRKHRINDSSYCFIDFVEEDNKPNKCVTISSNSALTELSIKIEKMKKKHKIDLIILDNISSMLIYNEDVTVLKFLHMMMTNIRKKSEKAVYSILKEGNEKLIADITLFADDVIEI